MKWKFFLIVVASGFLTLSACSKKASQDNAATPADSHAQANGSTQANADTQSSADTQESEAKKDLDEPLSSYLDVTGDTQWPSKWFFANETGFTDEDIMNTLEPGYRREGDVFKKRQMMENDLGSLKKTFEKFKGIKYVKFSDKTKYGQIRYSPYIHNGYDFSSQSFELDTDLCSGINDPFFGVAFNKSTNPNLCHMKITDQALAKKIESARQKAGAGSLFFTGTNYIKILGYQGGILQASAVHIHYDIGIDITPKYDGGIVGSAPFISVDL